MIHSVRLQLDKLMDLTSSQIWCSLKLVCHVLSSENSLLSRTTSMFVLKNTFLSKCWMTGHRMAMQLRETSDSSGKKSLWRCCSRATGRGYRL